MYTTHKPTSTHTHTHTNPHTHFCSAKKPWLHERVYKLSAPYSFTKLCLCLCINNIQLIHDARPENTQQS